MTLHDVFLLIQQWWLDESSGPQALFSFRIVSGALAIFAAGFSLLNAIHPNEIEHTWDREDCRRFGFIGWIKALGCVLAAIYFIAAAVFEADRATSPHRLLVNNAWATLILLAIGLESVAWRFHYLRKRMILRAQGEDVSVKT